MIQLRPWPVILFSAYPDMPKMQIVQITSSGWSDQAYIRSARKPSRHLEGKHDFLRTKYFVLADDPPIAVRDRRWDGHFRGSDGDASSQRNSVDEHPCQV